MKFNEIQAQIKHFHRNISNRLTKRHFKAMMHRGEAAVVPKLPTVRIWMAILADVGQTIRLRVIRPPIAAQTA